MLTYKTARNFPSEVAYYEACDKTHRHNVKWTVTRDTMRFRSFSPLSYVLDVAKESLFTGSFQVQRGHKSNERILNLFSVSHWLSCRAFCTKASSCSECNRKKNRLICSRDSLNYFWNRSVRLQAEWKESSRWPEL